MVYNRVLNLIINGLPSIRLNQLQELETMGYVLNLIINGLPSIPCYYNGKYSERIQSFKPYYKWITFNTI